MTNPSNTDEYLESLSPGQKTTLERVRKAIQATAPDAVESISYGMPAFKYKKKPLIYFGAFKDHLSIFPTAEPAAALRDKLKDFKMSKGTVQFTVEKPLSDGLIRELVQFRMAIIDSEV